jgi:uncharacterized membrane protein required for colicin V production
MGWIGLNWLDLTILLIAVFSLVVGYIQGMLRQVIWLAALYIALILGAQYHSLVGGWIRALTFQTHSSRAVNVVAFLIIVIVVSFLLSWLAADAYPAERLKLFPLLNQIGGSIVSLATTIATISILLWILTFSVGEPWPNNESLRMTIMGGLQTSLLVPFFDALKGPLLETIKIWMPALPAIFNL